MKLIFAIFALSFFLVINFVTSCKNSTDTKKITEVVKPQKTESQIKQEGIINKPIQRESEVGSSKHHPFWMFVKAGDVEEVKKILREEPDLFDRPYEVSQSFESQIILSLTPKVLRFIVSQRPEKFKNYDFFRRIINCTNRDNEDKVIESVKVLLSLGMDINKVDPRSFFQSKILSFAAPKMSKNSLKKLIDLGAKLETKDFEKLSKISLEVRSFLEEIFKPKFDFSELKKVQKNELNDLASKALCEGNYYRLKNIIELGGYPVRKNRSSCGKGCPVSALVFKKFEDLLDILLGKISISDFGCKKETLISVSALLCKERVFEDIIKSKIIDDYKTALKKFIFDFSCHAKHSFRMNNQVACLGFMKELLKNIKDDKEVLKFLPERGDEEYKQKSRRLILEHIGLMSKKDFFEVKIKSGPMQIEPYNLVVHKNMNYHICGLKNTIQLYKEPREESKAHKLIHCYQLEYGGDWNNLEDFKVLEVNKNWIKLGKGSKMMKNNGHPTNYIDDTRLLSHRKVKKIEEVTKIFWIKTRDFFTPLSLASKKYLVAIPKFAEEVTARTQMNSIGKYVLFPTYGHASCIFVNKLPAWLKNEWYENRYLDLIIPKKVKLDELRKVILLFNEFDNFKYCTP
ncbi:MAG: hypothetical protein KAQ98_10020 [Bacteriovoracaceae bacterium]|nr:hypothetical protein [Bacteriovoracaceae bacterium]